MFSNAFNVIKYQKETYLNLTLLVLAVPSWGDF